MQIIYFFLFACLFCSCRSHSVERQVNEKSIDSLHIVRLSTDSLISSVSDLSQELLMQGDILEESQYQRGDTVYKTRYSLNWTNRYQQNKKDTIRLLSVRTDTIHVHHKELLKQNNQKIRAPTVTGLISGYLGFVIVFCIAIYLYFKIRK